MEIYIGILLGMILSYIIYRLFYLPRLHKLEKEVYSLNHKYHSKAVKHGQAWEQFVPFMKDFPGDKQNFTFIGMPIDGIIFDDDAIKFVEIKTGSSGLNEKQKKVKGLIIDKKIEWHELRF